jgi:hypothetical protein
MSGLSNEAPLVATVCVCLFSSVTAPLIFAYRTQKMHREDRLAGYERDDALAKEKTVAAAAHQAEIAAIEQHDLVAKVDAKVDRVDAQTERIHTLVNSDLTSARQDQLDQAEALIVVLRRIIGAARAAGSAPAPADLEALDVALAHRDTLEEILADRAQQQSKAEDDASHSPAGRQLNAESAEKTKQDALDKLPPIEPEDDDDHDPAAAD